MFVTRSTGETCEIQVVRYLRAGQTDPGWHVMVRDAFFFLEGPITAGEAREVAAALTAAADECDAAEA